MKPEEEIERKIELLKKVNKNYLRKYNEHQDLYIANEIAVNKSWGEALEWVIDNF